MLDHFQYLNYFVVLLQVHVLFQGTVTNYNEICELYGVKLPEDGSIPTCAELMLHLYSVVRCWKAQVAILQVHGSIRSDFTKAVHGESLYCSVTLQGSLNTSEFHFFFNMQGFADIYGDDSDQPATLLGALQVRHGNKR